jgi:hypothetical protein
MFEIIIYFNTIINIFSQKWLKLLLIIECF